MKTLTAQVSDETFAEIEALAATAKLTCEEYVARQFALIAARKRRRATGDAEITAALDAMADDPDMKLSPERLERRNANWRELGEW